MTLRILAPSLVALVLAPEPNPPTAPPPREVILYFPTEAGSRWVYQCGEKEVTEVITAVEEKDGAKVISVAREEAGKLTPVERVLVSSRGLARVAAGGDDLGYELHMLSLPLEPGRKWVFKSSEVTVVGAERVEVPAGEFSAIRVEKVISFGRLVTFSYWFAPGVGVVRRTIRVEGGKEHVEVLKSFTRGKE